MVAHELAGTNGIPREPERAYLRVIADCDEQGGMRPLAVVWPDGRRFEVSSTTTLRTLGRWNYGNLVISYELTFKTRGRREVRRLIWWERGRWFCKAAAGTTS